MSVGDGSRSAAGSLRLLHIGGAEPPLVAGSNGRVSEKAQLLLLDWVTVIVNVRKAHKDVLVGLAYARLQLIHACGRHRSRLLVSV